MSRDISISLGSLLKLIRPTCVETEESGLLLGHVTLGVEVHALLVMIALKSLATVSTESWLLIRNLLLNMLRDVLVRVHLDLLLGIELIYLRRERGLLLNTSL